MTTTDAENTAPPNRRNVRLTLAYDGREFHGWQTQPGMRTVQEEVTRTLQLIVREPLVVFGASRTDAGVHARGQVANFHASDRIPLVSLTRAIAHRLPEDIVLIHLAEAPSTFHASRAAECKLYRYSIFASPTRPARDRAAGTSWHVWHPLCEDRMRAAAAHLVGTHDFAAFASAGSQRATTVRTVRRVEVRRRFEQVIVEVEGDGFLYNQVRNMVGTLVEVGRGHWPPERVVGILASCDRRNAGPTAPPQGLCLEWIRYSAASLARFPTEPRCPADVG